jgi:hypothetical protein
MSGIVRVTVVHALPDRAWRAELALPEGSTVAAALAQSGFATAFPEVGVVDERIGIHGRRTTMETIVRDGDRVEVYRPLLIDPKDARRKRATPAVRRR